MGNRPNWLFGLLIGCLGVGCLLAFTVPAVSQASGIVIAEPGYNFGQLSETVRMSHDFIVKNTGKTTLNIRDVQPT
ncbi:MAG TPA: hypothetical protein VEF34_09290 [Syntrophobacteraceae bacterium]|nr:hypothetical protein [Syntrophobacteraceae bacterium]